MILYPEQSLLLLVDVQENNTNIIHQHEQLIANCKDLLMIAEKFTVPVLASEHCPEKNGPTLGTLLELIETEARFPKLEFSCLASIEGREKITRHHTEQILLMGIETHACILQTALDLLSMKKQVFVLADATDSRFAEDKACAIDRMRQLGVQIISKQMLLFEWAKTAENAAYQTLSEQMLK